MTGYVLPEYKPNRRSQQLGLAGVKPSFGEGFGAAFEEAWVRNPGPSALRAITRMQYPVPGQEPEHQYGPYSPKPKNPREREEPDYTILEPEQANEKYGIGDELKFDARVAEPVAEQLSRLKREEIQRRDVMRRAESGFGTQLTAGLAASVLDPVNIASAFVPAISTAKAASLAARYGKTQGRAITGATEGAVGAAAVEPIVYGVAQEEQADYTAVDSLVNLTFGSALGAGLHLGVGALGDRISSRGEGTPLQREVDEMPREDQEAALRSAVSQVAEGEPVRVDAVLDAARLRPLGDGDSLITRKVEPEASAEIRANPDGRQRPDAATKAQRQSAGEIPLDEVVPDQRVAEMSTEQMRRALLESDITGLPNRRAFTEAQKRPGRISADVDSLKWVNDNLSHDAGNTLLKQVGDAFRRADAEAYHISGDEFIVQADSIAEADATMARVAEELENSTFRATVEGQTFEVKPGISYGRAQNLTEAEKRLQRHKEARERSGERAARGDRPGSVRELGRADEGGGRGSEAGQGGDRAARQIVVERAKNDARADPAPEYARASATAAEAAEEVKGPPRDLADEEKAITDDIAEREQALSQEERDGIRESVAEDEKTARTYEKAWKVAATCRIRNSGAA